MERCSGLMGKGWRADRQRGADGAVRLDVGAQFILSKNAFQCVSGELELPSCTSVHSIDSRRIAGERANYATARLSGANTKMLGEQPFTAMGITLSVSHCSPP